MITRSIGDF